MGEFPEEKTPPGLISFPTLSPNIEYFFGGYENVNFHLLLNKLVLQKKASINEGGRLVVNLPYDSAAINERVKEKLEMYNKIRQERHFDSVRVHKLVETIDFLKQKGEVFLVRMPIAEEMLALEKTIAPEFDNLVNKLSRDHNILYLNYSCLSDKYLTNDGNHLHENYSHDFTSILANDIAQFLKTKTVAVNCTGLGSKNKVYSHHKADDEQFQIR